MFVQPKSGLCVGGGEGKRREEEQDLGHGATVNTDTITVIMWLIMIYW